MCRIKEYQAEALLKGLTLIRKGDKPKHYLYKFNECGHEKEYVPSNLRRINPTCIVCQQQRFKSEAKKKGLKLIKKLKGTTAYEYRFIKCGHSYTAAPKRITEINPQCKICDLEEHKADAKKIGLELIGKGSKKEYHLYKFIECGHTKEYTRGHLKSLKPICEHCQLEQFKKEAKEKGLTIIRKNKSSYTYKFDDCGHTKDFQPSEVRNRNVYCEICGESHFQNDSQLYLIKVYKQGKSFLKLGVAQDLNTRIKNYKLKPQYKTEVLKTALFENRFTSTFYENQIHLKYKELKLNSEKMKLVMDSGYTECYPLSMKETLLNEINTIEKEHQKSDKSIAA